MEVALEIVFVAALVVVAASVAAAAWGRLPERGLLAAAITFAVLAVLSGIAVGIDVLESIAETDALLLVTGGLTLAALAEATLYALARGLRRVRDLERVGESARGRLEAYLDEQAEQRRAELDRTLARERANATYVLGEQERQLAEERRDHVARQAESSRVELTEAVASAQERLESRLRGWAADLDRGQRELESQLGELGQRQGEALAAYDARLTADAERLATLTEEQKHALAQLRTEFQRTAREVLEEGRNEVETHAAERRRALHEVGERLRTRERSLREQIEREEAEARSRLAAGLGEAERRQLAQLERALDRAATRLAEEAERRFDAQIKQSRERSAERLSRELEKSMEQFVRRAEKEISDRIGDLARVTAERMERRVSDVGRAAEAQHEVSAERLRVVSERLEKALVDAEERIAAFEAQIELELEAKLDALERSLRAADRE
jgi:chromosome segregation ATPase